MNLPAASVAESAYRVFNRIIGELEPVPFEELEARIQAQWEAVVQHLALVSFKASEDEEFELRQLEENFPAGWLPPRLRHGTLELS
jgi:hypothetical protein